MAQPVRRTRNEVAVARGARSLETALEGRQHVGQRQRVEDARHSQLVSQEAPPPHQGAFAEPAAFQRVECRLIVAPRDIHREGRHGLARGALRMVGGFTPQPCRFRVVGERFQRRRRRVEGGQGPRGAPVQGSPLVQRHAFVHGITGQPVLETNHFAAGREQEVALGQNRPIEIASRQPPTFASKPRGNELPSTEAVRITSCCSSDSSDRRDATSCVSQPG